MLGLAAKYGMMDVVGGLSGSLLKRPFGLALSKKYSFSFIVLHLFYCIHRMFGVYVLCVVHCS